MVPVKRDQGFTLVEVLAIIAILGILAAIVIFTIGNTREDGVLSVCRTDARAIELAAHAVRVHEGSYPTDPADLTNPARGGMLKRYPSSVSYVLSYTSDGDDFSVTSTKAGCP